MKPGKIIEEAPSGRQNASETVVVPLYAPIILSILFSHQNCLMHSPTFNDVDMEQVAGVGSDRLCCIRRFWFSLQRCSVRVGMAPHKKNNSATKKCAKTRSVPRRVAHPCAFPQKDQPDLAKNRPAGGPRSTCDQNDKTATSRPAEGPRPTCSMG